MDKLFPDADERFAVMASHFARVVGRDPDRYHLPKSDAQAIAAAVAAFAEAHALNKPREHKSSSTARRKDEARLEAQRLMRRAANRIRVNDQISAADKHLLGIQERPTRLRKRTCPQDPPFLRLVGARHSWQPCNGKHQILFCDVNRPHSRAKPDGADGIHLYCDILRPGEPVPDMPSRIYGRHPQHLGTFTRSPLAVVYPKYEGAVRIVYWARWVKLGGGTGRYSLPLVVAVDAFPTQPALPDRRPRAERGQNVTVTTICRELPDHMQTIEPVQPRSTHFLVDEEADAAQGAVDFRSAPCPRK
jgi:hypothetical protein